MPSNQNKGERKLKVKPFADNKDNKQSNKSNDSDSDYETPRTTRSKATRNNIRLANTSNQSPERLSKNKKALTTLREATRKTKVKPFADNLKLCITRLENRQLLPSTSRQVVFDSGSDLEANTRQIEPITQATLSETERVLKQRQHSLRSRNFRLGALT